MESLLPANARLFRKGYLKQAKPVVCDVRSFESVFSREHPRINDNEAYGDQRNLPDLGTGWQPDGDEINRAAFLIGPVVTKTGGDPTKSRVADIGK